MTQQSVTFQQVTVSEAAGILGVSTQTVRRMIRRGQLEGARVHRPQGSAYVVSLPVAGDTDPTATQQATPNVSRANATGSTTTLAPGEAMAALIQATLTPIVAPLVAQLEAHRQTVGRQGETIERQADQLVSQAETIGGLRAENATLRALQASQGASGSTQEPKPSTARSHPWWFLNRLSDDVRRDLATVLLIVAVLSMLVWVFRLPR